MQTQRYDLVSSAIKSHRETPQGGLLARANLTRTGVFHYHQPDGSVRRELRHPDEVFDKSSLDSLKGATVTVDHPSKVSPQNWKDVTVGHVVDAPHREGKFVAADLAVQHGPAMQDVQKGNLQELSCGYTCDVDPASGTYNGEKYDAVQRRIRYNHVALLPPGAGRAGPDVRLHLDGREASPEEIAQAALEREARVRAYSARIDSLYERYTADAGFRKLVDLRPHHGAELVAEVRADAAEEVGETEKARLDMISRDRAAWQRKRAAPVRVDGGKGGGAEPGVFPHGPPDSEEEEPDDAETKKAYDAMVKRDTEAWMRKRR